MGQQVVLCFIGCHPLKQIQERLEKHLYRSRSFARLWLAEVIIEKRNQVLHDILGMGRIEKSLKIGEKLLTILSWWC